MPSFHRVLPSTHGRRVLHPGTTMTRTSVDLVVASEGIVNVAARAACLVTIRFGPSKGQVTMLGAVSRQGRVGKRPLMTRPSLLLFAAFKHKKTVKLGHLSLLDALCTIYCACRK